MKKTLTLILATALSASMVIASAATAATAMALPDFTALIKNSADAVVSVSATREVAAGKGHSKALPFPRGLFPPDLFPPDFWERQQPRRGAPHHFQHSAGSGFIIDADGYVMTNAHVIANMDKIVITLKDGDDYEAEVVGIDERTDIALLKIESKKPLPVARIGDSDEVQVGQWVAALGSPYGLDQTLTAGIISALGRRLPSEAYVPFIQTDAAVNPGNSGGPLMDLEGNVIGINSQIVSPVRAFVGASFAIPINVAMRIQARLRTDGVVRRGRLGVAYTEVSPSTAEGFGLDKPRGALINDVVKGSAADNAGLQGGDIILQFNDELINSSVSLPVIVGDTPPGTTVTMSVWRDGGELEIVAVLDSLDDTIPKTILGLTLEDLDDNFKRETGLHFGVLVKEISGSRGAPEGINQFRPNDIITHLLVNKRRRPIENQSALAAGIKENKESAIVFFVWRNGRNIIFTVQTDN
ncbi:Do family serine endopeptidase [Candidatus Persebacteraceae bacterium Df01]|jgi:serine protease Do|uniref:Probable periplasmic serine endoprotease DegP-like n=1 Tax=Candidatus Doriopsillibacter californiensis TaxID=2970740 RepID=A0ABT7QKE9_9GAMM|nr:Do family serine endopeptidase [Candidatus Persebacteraceae bacterium Df01]